MTNFACGCCYWIAWRWVWRHYSALKCWDLSMQWLVTSWRIWDQPHPCEDLKSYSVAMRDTQQTVFTFSEIFLGRQPRLRCEGFSTFRGVTRCPTPLFISPFRPGVGLNANEFCRHESLRTSSIYFDRSDFFKLFGREQGWRLFPGSRAQTANDNRKSLLACGKPRCTRTFPCIPVTSQRRGTGVL